MRTNSSTAVQFKSNLRKRENTYLGMELVVTEVQGGVDWLKRLKVDIYFFLLPFVCNNGAAVHN